MLILILIINAIIIKVVVVVVEVAMKVVFVNTSTAKYQSINIITAFSFDTF